MKQLQLVQAGRSSVEKRSCGGAFGNPGSLLCDTKSRAVTVNCLTSTVLLIAADLASCYHANSVHESDPAKVLRDQTDSRRVGEPKTDRGIR